MKQIFILLWISVLFVQCTADRQPKPYETTWLEITETDEGPVVYNYPSLWDDGASQAPNSITIQGDTLVFNMYSDERFPQIFRKVEADDSSYLFPTGNYYRFMWADEQKHIARWITYYGEEPDLRILFDRLYVDSLHNPFPIVDFDWRIYEEFRNDL